MKTNHIVISAILAASTLVAGCASPGYPQATSPYPAPAGQQGAYASTGVVDSIQMVNPQSGPGGIGAGAVGGGLVGGLPGNQAGSGTGRTLATIAGAACRRLAGHQRAHRRHAGRTS